MTLLYNGKEIYEWFPCASQEFVTINPNHNGGGKEWQPANLSRGHTDQAQSLRDDQLQHVQKAHAYRPLPAVLFSPPLPRIGRLVLLQSTLLRGMLNITTDMYTEVWHLASFTGPGPSRMEKPEMEKDTSFRYCRMDTCMKWSGLPQRYDCQGQMRTNHTTPSTSPTYVSGLSKDLRGVRRKYSITAVFRVPSTRREKKLSRINQRSCTENNCKTPCSCGQRYIRKQWDHWRHGWRNIGQPHKEVKQTLQSMPGPNITSPFGRRQGSLIMQATLALRWSRKPYTSLAGTQRNWWANTNTLTSIDAGSISSQDHRDSRTEHAEESTWTFVDMHSLWLACQSVKLYGYYFKYVRSYVCANQSIAALNTLSV